MIELERTFLAKYLPKNLKNSPHIEMIDIYHPKTAVHPCLRLRKNGDEYVITKKTPVNENDKSVQHEQTIILTEKEFKSLFKAHGKVLEKIRYFYTEDNTTMEIDVFKGALEGLVLVDAEFTSEKEMKKFIIPDFCLVDVTQDDFVAGGMLAGKKYSDIASELAEFGYNRISGK